MTGYFVCLFHFATLYTCSNMFLWLYPLPRHHHQSSPAPRGPTFLYGTITLDLAHSSNDINLSFHPEQGCPVPSTSSQYWHAPVQAWGCSPVQRAGSCSRLRRGSRWGRRLDRWGFRLECPFVPRIEPRARESCGLVLGWAWLWFCWWNVARRKGKCVSRE